MGLPDLTGKEAVKRARHSVEGFFRRANRFIKKRGGQGARPEARAVSSAQGVSAVADPELHPAPAPVGSSEAPVQQAAGAWVGRVPGS